MRLVRAAERPGSDMFDAFAGLLSEPLRAPARAAVFRAIAKLPGVRYLGHIREPLGRPGVAVGIVQTAPTPVLAPHALPRQTLDELIFGEEPYRGLPG